MRIPEYSHWTGTSVNEARSNVCVFVLASGAVHPLLRESVRRVSTVEASLWVDTVASAGMGMSRSKLSEAIKAGLVLVNWNAVTSSTVNLRAASVFLRLGEWMLELVHSLVRYPVVTRESTALLADTPCQSVVLCNPWGNFAGP